MIKCTTNGVTMHNKRLSRFARQKMDIVVQTGNWTE